MHNVLSFVINESIMFQQNSIFGGGNMALTKQDYLQIHNNKAASEMLKS